MPQFTHQEYCTSLPIDKKTAIVVDSTSNENSNVVSVYLDVHWIFCAVAVVALEGNYSLCGALMPTISG